ncbi:MAG TPA: hypothetical protein VH817_23900 [Thermoleophilaceae bacterium]|jgi:hypothetical protein
MRVGLLLAVVAAFVLSVSLTVSDAGAKRHSCKAVSVHFSGSGTFKYPVKVLKGSVSCGTARTTLKHFIAKGSAPRGWTCFRGHGQDAWAATCATGSAAHPRKEIRAYNP